MIGQLVFLAFAVGAVTAAGLAYHWHVRKRAIPDPSRRARARARLRKIKSRIVLFNVASVLLVLALLMVLMVCAFEVLRDSRWRWLLILLIWPMVGVLAHILRSVHEGRCRAWFDRLTGRDHLLCPDCHHYLADVGDEGRCPQCGYTYTPDVLREDWSDVQRLSRVESPMLPRKQRASARFCKINPWSGYWPYAILLVAVVCLTTAVIQALSSSGLPTDRSTFVFCGVPVLLVAFFCWGLFRRSQFVERLEREKYLICPDCHYSLLAHSGGGRCPECGYAFTPESLVRDWKDVLVFYTFVPSYDWSEPAQGPHC